MARPETRARGTSDRVWREEKQIKIVQGEIRREEGGRKLRGFQEPLPQVP